MGFTRTGFAAGALALAVASSTPVAAETLTYKITLAPTNEVPPVPTRATGSADVTYDTVSRVVTWTVTHAGLSGTPTAAHFHGPSTTLENAPVIVVLPAPLTSPFKGQQTLTPEQATQFLGGLWYMNVHTPAYPGGELRGQVPKRP